MKDQLDRMLSAEEDLTPSSGFVKNVMDAVRLEASAPPPLAFPWRRALPGLILCVLALTTAGIAAFLRPGPLRVRDAPGPSSGTSWLPDPGALLRTANSGGLGWIMLALLLTLASVMLSLRLVGRKI